jgi:hypothetical protein
MGLWSQWRDGWADGNTLRAATILVRDAVMRYEQDGDPKWIFDEPVQEAVETITRIIGTRPPRDDAGFAVARWAWHGARLGDDPDELRAVLRLYGTLGQFAPEGVPDDVWPYLRVDAALDATDEDNPGAGVPALRDAADYCPPDHPRLGDLVTRLVGGLWERYQTSADLTELDAIVEIGRRRLPELTEFELLMTGTIVSQAYQELGLRRQSGADLDAGVELLTDLADQIEPREFLSTLLGGAYLSRHIVTGRDDDLATAVELLRAPDPDSPWVDPVESRTRLVQALLYRYARFGELADLDEAVTVGRAAVAADPQDRTTARHDLSGALRSRFEARHDLEDITAAIGLLRGLLARTDRSSRAIAHAADLGACLGQRYRTSHALADLREALAVVRAALPTATPGDLYELPLLTAAIDILVMARGRGLPTPDLDDVLHRADIVVTALPDGHPARAQALTHLLGARIRLGPTADGPFLGRTAFDADVLVDGARAAVVATPEGHVDASVHLSHLSYALVERFWRTEDPADAVEALTRARRAIELVGDRGYGIDQARFAVAQAMLTHAGYRDLTEAEESEAVDLLRTVAASGTYLIEPRLLAALMLARLEAFHEHWPSATAAYRVVLELLPVLVWPGIARTDGEHALATHPDLAADAASTATAAGDPGQAVQLLESGRAVLWGHVLNAHTDVSALHAVRADLADRLTEVMRELNTPPPGAADPPDGRWTLTR